MDKKTIIIVGLLVAALLFYWSILSWTGLYKPQAPKTTVDTTKVDTSTAAKPESTRAAQPTPAETTRVAAADTSRFAPDTVATHDTIIVETQKYRIALTSHGGGPVSIKLKQHTYRNGQPVEMLSENAPATPEAQFAGGTVSTAKLNFTADKAPGRYDATASPFDLVYTYRGKDGGEIIRRFHFEPDRYDYRLVVEMPDLRKLGFERRYVLKWNAPLVPTEPDSNGDYQSMETVAMMSGSRATLKDWSDDKLNQSLDGTTDWAAVRQKYFTAILIPKRPADGAVAEGTRRTVNTPAGAIREVKETVGLQIDFAGAGSVTDTFTVYAGPLDYLLLASYNAKLQDILGIGTTPFIGWIIKPFAIAVIWLLPNLYKILPNYGLVLILFAILVKLVTLPLSLKQFKSMNAMREIQPKMDEMRKKYKNNPQQLNVEMMRLYKEHGVNPFSGCLPMLVQMPLFIGMFRAISTTVLLRNAPFVWPIEDLSRGAHGLTDPYIVLVIIMVGFQVLSQKLTMPSTQQNKMLMYLMPLFFGFLFYKFAAGLTLYWAAFSALSLVDYYLFRRNKNQQVMPAQS